MSLESYKLEQAMNNLTGGRSVYRSDVLGGVLINYFHTTSYALETRITRDGRHVFMIGKSGYKSANDIPVSHRKARNVAKTIESNLNLFVQTMEGMN